MNVAYKPEIRKFVILLSLSVIVFIAGFFNQLIENIYSEGIYQISSVAQRFISSLVPFALGDFLYLLLILFVIWSLFLFYKKIVVKSLKKEDRVRIPLQVLNFILILYLLFKILWGLNYSRPSISKQLGISDEKYNTTELVLLGKFFINKLNHLQKVQKTRSSITELETKAKAGYDKMEQTNPIFKYRSPAVKPVLNSWIVTKIGIEGYYNPLSGEANVNTRLPSISLPFVTCHEIAHQLGIGREDEANLIGYLVASNSTDPNFQYSASYAMLKSILFEIRIKSQEDYDTLYATINAGTIQDFKNDRDFWRKYNNEMFGYLDVAFDRFLKLNNQQKGTDSYQDIVLWLYNIHKKELRNQ
ncbi:DUF3810 domain-containing protein [Pedobacter foliorum]|uniref:DUF3810 domain-containing protein n=1 Tax=Pedobacter foliorum TaxID=2739058 RepID=UPI0015652943|nr:DUF3810 domain-containing protein [Pedobacter foliorum]NRF40980.1 DUF3810 domain-containing protein [Pedobacter foliorum]